MADSTTPAPTAPATRDMLLVQSKVRELIRTKDATARVSEEFLNALNDEIYTLVDKSLQRCNENKRKTLSKADV
jgi:histone H3/H4